MEYFEQTSMPRRLARSFTLAFTLALAHATGSGSEAIAQTATNAPEAEGDETTAAQLDAEVARLRDAGRYAAAIPINERALAIYRRVLSENDWQLAIALND